MLKQKLGKVDAPEMAQVAAMDPITIILNVETIVGLCDLQRHCIGVAWLAGHIPCVCHIMDMGPCMPIC